MYVYSDQFLHSVRGSVTRRLGLHHVQGSRQFAVVERIHLLHLNDLLSLMARQGSLFLHLILLIVKLGQLRASLVIINEWILYTNCY